VKHCEQHAPALNNVALYVVGTLVFYNREQCQIRSVTRVWIVSVELVFLPLGGLRYIQTLNCEDKSN